MRILFICKYSNPESFLNILLPNNATVKLKFMLQTVLVG